MALSETLTVLLSKFTSQLPLLNNLAANTSILNTLYNLKHIPITSTSAVPKKEKQQIKTEPSTAEIPSTPWYNHPLVYFLTLASVPTIPLVCGVLILTNTLPVLPNTSLNIFFITPVILLLLVSVIDYFLDSYAETLHFGDELQKESAVKQVFVEQHLAAQQRTSGAPSKAKKRNEKNYTRVLQWYTVYHVLVYLFCFVIVKQMQYSFFSMDFWIIAFSMGMLGTNPGAATAHELFHKLNNYESFFGKLLLALFQYNHFFISHVYHHHKYVATPLDPVSARRNESIYQFVPRAIWGGYQVSWEREKERLALKDYSFWSIQNRMLRYALVDFFVMPFGAFLLFGTAGVQLLLAQSVLAICMLEIVNYMEHYGLERQIIGVDEKNQPIYEPVNDTHSWDGFNVISAYLSLNINYHAMHHEYPLRSYSDLKPRPTSPKMPCNYQLLFLLSLIPPLFFKVMNRILDEHNQQYKQWQQKYK